MFKRKSEKNKNIEKGIGVEESSYYFTPSFLWHNGKYACILNLFYELGSNRYLSYKDIMNIIPTILFEGVSANFICKDSIIKGDEKIKLINANAGGNKKIIDDIAHHGDSIEQTNKQFIKERICEIEDYSDYELLVKTPIPIVCFELKLLLIGNSKKIIDEQILALNTYFDKNFPGLKWDSLAGTQKEEFETLFTTSNIHKVNTSDGRNWSGFNFSVSEGLNDEFGVPIGNDVLSLTGSSCFFDFNKYLNKKSIIAIPNRQHIVGQYDNKNSVPVSSIIAQKLGNNINLYGNNIHHIVLNNFDYFDNQIGYYRPNDINKIFGHYDMSKININPTHGFGDVNNIKEDIVNEYSNLLDKIVNIFDILRDFKLSEEDKAIILNALKNYYMNNRLWNVDAQKNYLRTNIVRTYENFHTAPRLTDLIANFTSNAQLAIAQNRHLKADRIEALQQILDVALTAHINILGKTTNIKPEQKIQTYYDFCNIKSNKILQVQFINLIDYILYMCNKGDVICVHGSDRIYVKVFLMILERINNSIKKGIRWVFAFDTVTAQKTSNMQMLDMFEMKKCGFYQDLDSEIDWCVIGTCLPEEIEKFEQALNTPLSEIIKASMKTKTSSTVLVHRRAGHINNFVDLLPII